MYERILVPLDGSKVGEAALPYVEELVSKSSPEVEIEVILFQVISSVVPSFVGGEVAVNIPYTEKEMEKTIGNTIIYLNKAGESLRSKGATVNTKVGIGNTASEIMKAAAEINVDLIAMSTHGRSGLSRWAFGSVTDRVLRHGGNIPILMIRAPKEAEKV